MPRDVFASREDARSAARAFVSQWAFGGHDERHDFYWARDDVYDDVSTTPRLTRLTKFTVQNADAEAVQANQK